jgi:hypothetical protein
VVDVMTNNFERFGRTFRQKIGDLLENYFFNRKIVKV